MVTVHRSRGKDTPAMSYEVIDNPARLTDKDWHRVVAVFALGAAWQFKGWYWTTPTDIFTHGMPKWRLSVLALSVALVKGFFVQYEDEQTPDLIKQWSVKVIKVSHGSILFLSHSNAGEPEQASLGCNRIAHLLATAG